MYRIVLVGPSSYTPWQVVHSSFMLLPLFSPILRNDCSARYPALVLLFSIGLGLSRDPTIIIHVSRSRQYLSIWWYWLEPSSVGDDACCNRWVTCEWQLTYMFNSSKIEQCFTWENVEGRGRNISSLGRSSTRQYLPVKQNTQRTYHFYCGCQPQAKGLVFKLEVGVTYAEAINRA